MNNKEFLLESKEFIEREYSEFLTYQNLVWEIFIEFCKIADSSDIPYYMVFGSLIGIVRDNGKIPWDYDIDVCISINNREKLIESLKTKLKKDYYYTYVDNISDYPATCLRICKHGFPFTSIHLDVYFLIGCPKNGTQAFVNKIEKYHKFRAMKYGYIWFPNVSNSFLHKLAQCYIRIRAAFIPDVLLKLLEDKIWHKYPLGDSKYCSIVGDPYLHYYEFNWFSTYQIRRIDDVDVKIPIGYDSYLKRIYGNYNDYLPIKNRFNEFYKMLNVIRERQVIMNGSKKYSKFKQ